MTVPTPKTTTGTVPANAENILPGTTFPLNNHPTTSPPTSLDSQQPPPSFPGPQVNSRPTTLTLYSPAQLAHSPLLPSIVRLINAAFSASHSASQTLPGHLDRLASAEEYITQIGTDPGTFVYVLTWANSEIGAGDGDGDGDGDGGAVIGTAGAHRYALDVVEAVAGDGGKAPSAFRRANVPEGAQGAREVWELKLLAVETGLQGQGVAGYLMNSVDAEVAQRAAAAAEKESLVIPDVADDVVAVDEGASRREQHQQPVYMVLTTVKEVNEGFYARRGYGVDYENWHPPGFYGSEKGFTIIHMSKVLGV